METGRRSAIQLNLQRKRNVSMKTKRDRVRSWRLKISKVAFISLSCRTPRGFRRTKCSSFNHTYASEEEKPSTRSFTNPHVHSSIEGHEFIIHAWIRDSIATLKDRCLLSLTLPSLVKMSYLAEFRVSFSSSKARKRIIIHSVGLQKANIASQVFHVLQRDFCYTGWKRI